MPKAYNPHDKFFRRAKEEGYRARSAFKLEAIQNRFRLIKPGNHVLDLGAAPGSFLQFIAKTVGDNGMAIGVDLKSITPFDEPNIHSFVGDIFDESIYKKIDDQLGVSRFHVITSDLAPATTGIKSVDAGQSFRLNEQVLAVAAKHLKSSGHVVVKAFPGMDHDQLLALMKKQFKQIKLLKPEAVRSSSREIYVIGMNKISNYSADLDSSEDI